MPLDFKLIEAFLCVFEEGSITRAAKKLNLVQSAISKQIKTLEGNLNIELFERQHCGILPTSKGRALYHLYAPLMEGLRQAENEALALQEKHIQEISVGINPFANNSIMGNVLQIFRNHFPKVEIQIEEAVSTTLLDHVTDGSLDLAIVHFGLQSTAIPPTVNYIVLAQEELVFVERNSGDSNLLEPLNFSGLADYPLALPKFKFGFRQDLEYMAARLRVPLIIALEINAPETLVNLVANGGIASVVPEIVARQAALHLPLHIRKIINPTVQRNVLAVHQTDKHLTLAHTEFIKIVKDVCCSVIKNN